MLFFSNSDTWPGNESISAFVNDRPFEGIDFLGGGGGVSRPGLQIRYLIYSQLTNCRGSFEACMTTFQARISISEYFSLSVYFSDRKISARCARGPLLRKHSKTIEKELAYIF